MQYLNKQQTYNNITKMKQILQEIGFNIGISVAGFFGALILVGKKQKNNLKWLFCNSVFVELFLLEKIPVCIILLLFVGK